MYRINFELYGTVVSKTIDSIDEAQKMIDVITKKAHRAAVVYEDHGKEWCIVAYNKYVTEKNVELFGMDPGMLGHLFTRVVYKTPSEINWHPYLSEAFAMKDYEIIANAGVPVYLINNEHLSLKANLGSPVRV